MARTEVVLYQEEDGRVPVLEWLDSLQPRAVAKCRVRIERLKELGHQLRRPEADYLRDGIYELRVSLGGVNYRILYSFHGPGVPVLLQGLTKERVVPAHQIDKAIIRKIRFTSAPQRHTYRERR